MTRIELAVPRWPSACSKIRHAACDPFPEFMTCDGTAELYFKLTGRQRNAYAAPRAIRNSLSSFKVSDLCTSELLATEYVQ